VAEAVEQFEDQEEGGPLPLEAVTRRQIKTRQTERI
jgi:hypothetical protein